MVAVISSGSRPGPAARAHRLAVVPAPASRPLPTPSTFRLPAATYRRRRLAAVLVVAGLAFAAWAALGALGGALTAPGRSVPSGARGTTTVVEVGPGDSLWSLARRIQPHGDPRPVVDRLAAAHGGAVLRVGERISLAGVG